MARKAEYDTATQFLVEAPEWSAHISRAQWRERILELDPPLRGAVAAIVWWDVFSVRLYNDRHNDLDDLIGSAAAVEPEVLVAGLVQVGYSEHRARNRIFPQQNAGARGRPRKVALA